MMTTLPLNRFVFTSVAGLAFCAVTSQLFGRGRSFPIEVTGTITSVDAAVTQFTMTTDQPAGILLLAIGRDCKFTYSGAPATDAIVKKGRHIKASYYSTIFTGKIAVELDGDPVPEVATGVIESVDAASKRLSLRVNGSWHPLTLIWTSRAHFIQGRRTVSPSALRSGLPVKVSYYALEFAAKYAIAVELAPATESATKHTHGK